MQALSKVDKKQYKTVFFHGDLGPYNILWKDGKLIGRGVVVFRSIGTIPGHMLFVVILQVGGRCLRGWWKGMMADWISEYFETV